MTHQRGPRDKGKTALHNRAVNPYATAAQGKRSLLNLKYEFQNFIDFYSVNFRFQLVVGLHHVSWSLTAGSVYIVTYGILAASTLTEYLIQYRNPLRVSYCELLVLIREHGSE